MDNKQNSNTFLLYIGIAVIIVAVGYSLKLIIPAIGAAIGIAGGIIVGSTAVSLAYLKAGAIGLAIGGISLTLNFFVNNNTVIKNKSYEFILPILAIISGLAVDITEEIFIADNVGKILIGTITALLFYIGGKIWIMKGFWYKLSSILCFMIVPIYTVVTVVSENVKMTGKITFINIDSTSYIYLGILLFLTFVISLVSKFLPNDS